MRIEPSDLSEIEGEPVIIDGVKYTDTGRHSGLCICKECGKQFYDHPMFWGVLGYHDRPFLQLICGNYLVKL